MKTILIGYNLNDPGDHDELVAAVKDLGKWWHHLNHTWLVRTDSTQVEVRDALKPHLGAADELLVIDVTAAPSAWTGFDERGNQWLIDHL